jgi:hypothetical protein
MPTSSGKPLTTKAEALALFQNYQRTFADRVDSQILSAATGSQPPFVIGYGGVSNAVALAVATELQNTGLWTVTNDNTAKTITLT